MKRPWMAFYPADYLADTTHLTTQQHGAYFLLMLRYWVSGGIPHDDGQLAQIARLDLDTWLREKPTILSFFKADLSHKRIDLELTKAAKISRVRSASASKRRPSERRKTHIPPDKSDLAIAQQLHTQSQSQVEDAAADARGRDPPISKMAWDLASETAVIAGHSSDPAGWPPGWCGAPQRIQFMLDRGWRADLIVVGSRACAARSVGRQIRTVQFFEGAIADEHARLAKPLPSIETVPEQSYVQTSRPDQSNLRIVSGGFAAFARDRAKSSG